LRLVGTDVELDVEVAETLPVEKCLASEHEQLRSWVVRQALVRDMHAVMHHGAYS
jgi:hypothetical protein